MAVRAAQLVSFHVHIFDMIERVVNMQLQMILLRCGHCSIYLGQQAAKILINKGLIWPTDDSSCLAQVQKES